ncbi:hypothetical protein FHX81_3759 [Saccharothrix saharensis]|uniref:Uncharacterized protein n=1 Tax=Saccharothrix saharensis TaxID=571190 RepID=A0A543JF25_9PSEU|nr:hypothetical protein [Saccharothrix saharensis]TQM81394.1 hypothetical protein FHX81_3759 [Saccharothrix saharensis]
MKINDTHFTTPREDTDEVVGFDEEFDRLLGESSLGAPNARAVRELTDRAKVEAMLDRTEEDGGEIGHGDADTALLALVRAAASDPAARHTTGAGARPCAQPWPMGAKASLGMLAHLAEVDVFRYVHRDIARMVLDTVLKVNVPRLLARLTNGAIESSRIVDETAEALLTTDVEPGSSRIDSTGSTGFAHHPTGLGKSITSAFILAQLEPHGEVRTHGARDRVVRQQGRLDELLDVLVRFIESSTALVGADVAEPAPPGSEVDPGFALDQVDALILAPLYEGPKDTAELESAVRIHLGLRDLSTTEFRERLHRLYRDRLVGRAARPQGHRSRANLRLTAAGRRSFTEWLTGGKDRERAEVVVRILSTTMFDAAQRARLYVRRDRLGLHQGQTATICGWMAENLPPELFRTCSTPDRLAASHELLRTILGES